tara:strand:+ start:1083 stop:1454 length:372 start_codon:yes stop_codon:yes gene_type:complete
LVTQKNKLFNDPIYGFISIEAELILRLIDYPYFQGLRRISQMGLSSLVYPGANHTRFEHALGSMYVMQKAIDVLILKGIENHDYDSVHYFVFNGSISNQTYISDESQILILDKKIVSTQLQMP